jgi:hypothetical protein
MVLAGAQRQKIQISQQILDALGTSSRFMGVPGRISASNKETGYSIFLLLVFAEQ